LARLLLHESIGEPDVWHHLGPFHQTQIVVFVSSRLPANAGLHSVQRVKVFRSFVGRAALGDELQKRIDLFMERRARHVSGIECRLQSRFARARMNIEVTGDKQWCSDEAPDDIMNQLLVLAAQFRAGS